MGEGLTKRQREILEFIESESVRRGIPPTVREIAAHFGIASPNGVVCHIKALEDKGYIVREPGLSRGIRPARAIHGRQDDKPAGFPLLGEVAAGMPALAVQAEGEEVTLDEAAGARPGDFLLKVKGESMTGAGINPGDVAVVRPGREIRNGEIAVVLVGGEEATIKRYYKEKDGRIRLVPENPAFDIALIDPAHTPVALIGTVAGIIRKY
jgi:repressor LexA